MEKFQNIEDFYSMTPGAIGTIRYMYKTKQATQEELDSISSRISSQRFSAYLASGGDGNPQAAFERFRREARVEADKVSGGVRMMELHVQIGQAESVAKILEIEQSEKFIQWEDDNIVSCIKQAPIVNI